jgi:hypothetical protein
MPGPGPRRPVSGGRKAAVDGALALTVVLVIVQMWLLTAALEAELAGERGAAVPAAVASGLLFAGALAVYRFLVRLDRRPD